MYNGTSGRIHGEKNDNNPSKNRPPRVIISFIIPPFYAIKRVMQRIRTIIPRIIRYMPNTLKSFLRM